MFLALSLIPHWHALHHRLAVKPVMAVVSLADNAMCCRFVIAGGVACNRSVRSSFAELAEDLQLELTIPDPHFCTDNGAMVAWAGLERSAYPYLLMAPGKFLWHAACIQCTLTLSVFHHSENVKHAQFGRHLCGKQHLTAKMTSEHSAPERLMSWSILHVLLLVCLGFRACCGQMP